MNGGVCLKCGSDLVDVAGDTIWCQRCGALISDLSVMPRGQDRIDAPMPEVHFRRGGVIPRKGCSVEGCDRPHVGRGLCSTHYNRARWAGTLDKPWRGCNVPGCGRVYYALGLCCRHYREQRRWGEAGRI